jgi:ectoine hydroxylase-related dioxygenase (phytanoyl-CoA dioxygenase family)
MLHRLSPIRLRFLIPGSHKASMTMPESDRRRGVGNEGGPTGLWINPGPLQESGHLVLPAMRAGDLLLFMGSGQTHGAEAWRAAQDRCAVLINIWGPNMIRGRRPIHGDRPKL